MANDHIITLSSPAYIHVDSKRVVIENKGKDPMFFAPHDIAVLILDHPALVLTHEVFRVLAESNAIVLSCTREHLPDTMTIPLFKNKQGARNAFYQIKAMKNGVYKKAWQQIIQSKLYGQVYCAEKLALPNLYYLYDRAKKVTLDNAYEQEAFAAKLYWQAIFKQIEGADRRYKQGAEDIINTSLNYGYAVVRAMVARSLCAHGLVLNYGVGHIRKDNPFNLVEDFIEPYRFLVDSIVLPGIIQGKIVGDELSPITKRYILSQIVEFQPVLGKATYRLLHGIDKTITSFCKLLEVGRGQIELPNKPQKGRPSKTFPTLKHTVV